MYSYITNYVLDSKRYDIVGGNMKQWQVIRTLNPHAVDVEVGMWSNDNRIFFSIENLKPEDFVDSDTYEFPVLIDELEEIIKEVKRIKQT